MSRIDYSKWDHISDSDDDHQQEEDVKAPRVTKLEQPSRITTQSDGSILVQPQIDTSSSTESPKVVSELLRAEKSAVKGMGSAAVPSDWTEKGDHIILEDENNMELWWSQDRYSVTIRMALPFSQKLQVQVEGILPYSERHVATGSQKPRLLVRFSDNSTIWFQGELPHPVHLAEDEEKEIDWTIVTGPHKRRYFTVVLYKATPMAGMFWWWKQPFTNCPERSLEDDEDVHQSSQSFQRAWKDAQQQFAENIKTRPKHTV